MGSALPRPVRGGVAGRAILPAPTAGRNATVSKTTATTTTTAEGFRPTVRVSGKYFPFTTLRD